MSLEVMEKVNLVKQALFNIEQTAVMNYVSKFLSNFKEFYNEINSATLTGAIDVVVVRLEDGSFACSPFHVRFGKIGVLRCREKVVDIEINGESVDIHMKLGETGEAFFVEETEAQDEVPSYLATSPIPSYDIQKELAKLATSEEQLPQQDGLDVRLSSDYSPVKNNRKIYDQVEGHKDNIASQSTDSTDDVSGPKLKKTNPASKSGEWSNLVNLPSKYTPQGRISVSEDGMTADTTSKAGTASNYLPQYSTSDQAGVTDDEKQKSKKKRRKRSIVRKRKGRETPGQVTAKADTSDDEPEEIFQMDVDEDEADGSHSNSSSSTSLQNRKSTIPVSSPSTMQVDKMSNSVIEPPLHARDVELGFPSTSRAPSHSWPYKSSLQLNLEIHPFSDGDVTPIMSPVTSRPPTPKSDTEYEIQKQEAASQTESGDNRWSWTWGELPVPPKAITDKQSQEMAASDDEGIHSKHMEPDSDEQRSMLGGVFRFMRKTKKIRHQPESEGIYLDDLNPGELDPEIAKLYFPQRSSSLHLQNAADMKPNVTHVKDEDVESGNGSSLPQSPYSMEGGLGNLHGIDSDSDDRHTALDFKGYNDLAVSLCGGLTATDGDIPHEQFLHSVVTYDDFCEHPEMLQNPNLVIRLNNKYYNWQTAAPMILSLILYQRPLAERTIDNLVKENMPKKPKKSETKGYSWWWRRNAAAEEEAKAAEKKLDSENVSKSDSTILAIEQDSTVKKEDSVCDSGTPSPIKENPTIRVKQDSVTSTSDLGSLPQTDESETYSARHEFKEKHSYTGNEKFKKTLRLTSEQISCLNLQEGPNEVVFSVTTALQGTTRCKCHIYLWNYDDKIVISDIDGTITKSDVLGHILPIIGKDWAQSGVAQLFTKIKNNGYQFLYLSARAIGQAHITREYLKSVRQGDVRLPDGPLLLNPSSLISAFHREVIEKKPEEFKISCLKDIQALFPSVNPFYAGYGNRINDVWAYRAVGIPISRIFTINHKGELKHELTQTFQSTYSGLSYVVDHLFPPLRRSSLRDGMLTSDFEGSDEYSAFTYWRQPISEVHVDIEETESTEKAKPEEKSSKVSTST